MKKIAHIVNPVKVSPDNKSYLYVAQPVTFQSMLVARDRVDSNTQVELFTAQYPEDREIIPKKFNITSDLEKSIHDFHDFKDKSRKLPRIKDIIDKLYRNSDADIFIYTNTDIGVKPDFYIKVLEIYEQGIDGFCINRRDIPKKVGGILMNETQLETIYKQKGYPHPGIDCFIFKRDIVPKLELANVFVGYPPVGLVLKEQIQKHSKKFYWFKNLSLTFHLGRDATWMKKTPTNNEYWSQNKKEGNKVLSFRV